MPTQPPARSSVEAPSAETTRAALPSLTSMRALAASAVFLAHCGFFLGSDPPDRMLGLSGAAGVSFFFILSGAILAYNYPGGFSARRFYRKRFARIVPVYLLALVVGVVVLAAHERGVGFLDVRTLVANLFMLQGWFPDAEIVPRTSWTLSCELLFYALFPLLIAPLGRLAARPAALVAGALLVVATVLPGTVYEHVLDDPFFLRPIVQLPLFALGVLMGLHLPVLVADAGGLLRRRATDILVACGILAAAAAPAWPHVSASIDPYIPICTLAILAGAAADHNGPHWLSDRRLVVAGLWSYAFYSVHQPLLSLVVGAVPGAAPSPAVGLPVALATFAGVWYVAGLIFRRWEEPWRERIGRGRPKEVVVAGEAAIGEPVVPAAVETAHS